MSKYDNYGQFMIAVLNDADQKSINLGSRLKNYLHVSDDTVMQIVTTILGVGWAAFVAVCGLLLLGPVAFVVALATFVARALELWLLRHWPFTEVFRRSDCCITTRLLL